MNSDCAFLLGALLVSAHILQAIKPTYVQVWVVVPTSYSAAALKVSHSVEPCMLLFSSVDLQWSYVEVGGPGAGAPFQKPRSLSKYDTSELSSEAIATPGAWARVSWGCELSTST